MSTASIRLADDGAQDSTTGDQGDVPADPGSQDESRLHTKAMALDAEKQGSMDDTGQAEAEVRTRYPWMRLFRVIVMLVVYFVLEVVVKVLTVAQFLFVAWRKRPHDGMKRWGAMIAGYMDQMWRYSTFASDAAPWPFSPWPRNTDTTLS